ncbi:MAG: ArsA family ATPase [Candidatus Desulfofervidaceae bacterium]|nr:ArsA family ATPase [Candidatus Desulfofervidaceae bacterium]
MKRVFFFLGKGGVGKSTLSASLAYHLSHKGHKVYWASIDPAHNLYDILSLPPFMGVKQVEPCLWVEEVDIDAYLRLFLQEIETKTKHIYSYLQVLNLEKMFTLVKNAPGMEESAVLYALRDILTKHKDIDYIIIDTPPTGLMLKIFTLPFVTKLWLEKLMKWRKTILDRRRSIAHIKGKDYFGKNTALELKEDTVFQELKDQEKTVEFLQTLLTNKEKTCFFLVLNPDKLSLIEGKRILEVLKTLNLHIALILLNKTGFIPLSQRLNSFKNIPVKKIPFLGHNLDKDSLLKLATYWVEDVCQ